MKKRGGLAKIGFRRKMMPHLNLEKNNFAPSEKKADFPYFLASTGTASSLLQENACHNTNLHSVLHHNYP